MNQKTLQLEHTAIQTQLKYLEGIEADTEHAIEDYRKGVKRVPMYFIVYATIAEGIAYFTDAFSVEFIQGASFRAFLTCSACLSLIAAICLPVGLYWQLSKKRGKLENIQTDILLIRSQLATIKACLK